MIPRPTLAIKRKIKIKRNILYLGIFKYFYEFDSYEEIDA